LSLITCGAFRSSVLASLFFTLHDLRFLVSFRSVEIFRFHGRCFVAIASFFLEAAFFRCYCYVLCFVFVVGDVFCCCS